jgi:hypothetical protein
MVAFASFLHIFSSIPILALALLILIVGHQHDDIRLPRRFGSGHGDGNNPKDDEQHNRPSAHVQLLGAWRRGAPAN